MDLVERVLKLPGIVWLSYGIYICKEHISINAMVFLPGMNGTSRKGKETPPDDRETPPDEWETPPNDWETPPDEWETPPNEWETPPNEWETPPSDWETPPNEWETPPNDWETPPNDWETPPDGWEAPPNERETPPISREATSIDQNSTSIDQNSTSIDKNSTSIDQKPTFPQKKPPPLLLFLLLSLFLPALAAPGDSLQHKLAAAATDTAKAMLYNSAARDLITGRSRDYYQTVQFAQLGRVNENYHQAIRYVREGLALAEEAGFERGKAELLRTMGIAWFYLSDYDQAVECYRRALEICEKTGNTNGMALNYYNIALAYQNQQTKAYYQLENLQKALSIWEQSGATAYISRAYELIIRVYRDVEEWPLAKAYAEEALRLALRAGNRIEEATLYEMLAQINSLMNGNLREREEYLQKSLGIYRQLADSLRVALVTAAIADEIYADRPAAAIRLLRQSIAIYEQTSPTNIHLSEVYDMLANSYLAADNPDSARHYKEKALGKAILSGDARRLVAAYNATGKFYSDARLDDRAERDFRSAYQIALASGYADLQSIALSGLSDVKHRKGDYAAAIRYLRQLQAVNDSLNRDENIRKVRQLAIRYDYEKDVAENAEIYKAQYERQQQAIKNRNVFVAIITVALLFIASLTILIMRSVKRKTIANDALERQHREIMRINNALQASNSELSGYKDALEIKIRQQAARIRQTEIQLRSLSDNLPRGCIYRKIARACGKETITYIGGAAVPLLGLSADAIMTDVDAFHRHIPPDDMQRKRELERESAAAMQPYSLEYRMTKDDREVWLLEKAIPRAGDDNTIVWDAIIVDITEHKKFEKELILAKEHAEESDIVKSSFLSSMSHEIRTPMNGIVGFLNFVERDDLTAEKRQIYTNIIRGCSQQLLQLIDDIIDLSKIDSNQLTLYHVPFDLNALMDELETSSQNLLLTRYKKLDLSFDRYHFILPCIIKSDPVRLQQIMNNLIGNAIKFTEKGYIRFGYRLEERNTKLCLFVEDTGVGIHESKHEYIFERFRQAHDETSNTKYGGTGLGLAISKSLAEMMGGQIGVFSEAGKGSRFYFTLPYHPVD